MCSLAVCQKRVPRSVHSRKAMSSPRCPAVIGEPVSVTSDAVSVLLFFYRMYRTFISLSCLFYKALCHIWTCGYCIRNSFPKPTRSIIIIDDILVSNTTGRSVTRTIHTSVYVHALLLLPQPHIAPIRERTKIRIFFFFCPLLFKITGDGFLRKAAPLLSSPLLKASFFFLSTSSSLLSLLPYIHQPYRGYTRLLPTALV